MPDFGDHSSGLGPWAARLQQASWKNTKFAVRESTIVRGRRTALHEYPERDSVYVEDLGRATRRYTFRGFLVGDDVFDQRDAMVVAVEQPGVGTLVHPSIGTITASLIGFSAREDGERGRVVDLSFEFIENVGRPIFPTNVVSTRQATKIAADAAASAVASDFSQAVKVLSLGLGVVKKD